MRERPVTIGKNPVLAGILCEPTPPQSAGARPLCLLVNAGLVHRVGPNRLYVQVARALAGHGYRSFRVDLSARGDSEARRDGISFIESSVIEMRSVMDHLERTAGATQFVVMGICSGAINSLQAAIVDARVAGCIAIDAPAYPTWKYYVRHYRGRLLRADSWRNTFAGRNAIGRLLRGGGARSEPAPHVDEEFGEPFEDRPPRPSREEAEILLAKITGRGGRILSIFSGSWSSYNYSNQFRDAFPSIAASGLAEVSYYPDSDHTFTRLYNQRRLLGTIQRWMSSNWPTDGGPAQVGVPGAIESNSRGRVD